MKTNVEYHRKHISLEDALKWREECKRRDRKLVFTNGCFDLIHPGHLLLFQEARKWGDYLIVALNSDDSIQRLKGEARPIMPLEARLMLVCSLESVDKVIVFDEDTPLNLLEALKPECYIKGTGWNLDQIPEVGVVKGYGGNVVLLDSLAQYSTTGIIQKIRSIPADLL